jgi:ribonuclease P protein component
MRQAFPARHRLRARREFQLVYDRGSKVHGRFMTVFTLPNSLEVSRLGISATRKLGGAVERNRAKRVMREVFRTHTRDAGFDVVVIPRRDLFTAEFTAVEHEYESLFRRSAGRSTRPSRA